MTDSGYDVGAQNPPDTTTANGHTITADTRRDGAIDWQQVRSEVGE